MLSRLKSRKTLKFLDKRATMIICWQIWTFFLILALITSKYRKMKTRGSIQSLFRGLQVATLRGCAFSRGRSQKLSISNEMKKTSLEIVRTTRRSMQKCALWLSWVHGTGRSVRPGRSTSSSGSAASAKRAPRASWPGGLPSFEIRLRRFPSPVARARFTAN